MKPYPESLDRSACGISAEAVLSMGVILGSWKVCRPEVRDLFALSLVRRCVSTALQAEGYSFTAEQFSYWLAGAAVLDPGRPRLARPARFVCELVLNALARSRCEEVGRAAERFRLMAVPIADHGEYGDIGQCHEALDAAREIALRSRFAGGRGPSGVAERVAATAKLARAASQLATRLAEDRPFDIGGRRTVVRDEPERAAYWALDLEIEGFFADALPGMPPLPCPGLFDRAWLRPDVDADECDNMAIASFRLGSALGELVALMERAVEIDRACDRTAAGVSLKSRLPQLVGVLSIMERLRSSQIEAALNVTRIGVRSIVASGVELRMVRNRKGRGLNMIEIDMSRREAPPLPSRRDVTQSMERETLATAEVDDALLFAEKVLGRVAGPTVEEEMNSGSDDHWDDDIPAWV